MIFQATTTNLQKHCRVTSRRKRDAAAAEEELVTLDKQLMTEALLAQQSTLEQVGHELVISSSAVAGTHCTYPRKDGQAEWA